MAGNCKLWSFWLSVIAVLFPVYVLAQTGQTVLTSQEPTSATNEFDEFGQLELGMKFSSSKGGYITALRHWKVSGDDGIHYGRLWEESTGKALGLTQFLNESPFGWQEQQLAEPIPIFPNKIYIVSANVAHTYPITPGGLATEIVNGYLRSIADGNNGAMGGTASLPVLSSFSSNYFRDVRFIAGPTVTILSGDEQSISLDSESNNPLVVLVRDEDWQPVPNVPVTFSVVNGSGTVRLLSGVTDVKGRAFAYVRSSTEGGITVKASAENVGSVNFNLHSGSSVFPSSWSVHSTQSPPHVTMTDGGTDYELGMKFFTSRNGRIKSIRYYKSPQDAGAHVGRIWDYSTGTQLTSIEFTNESSSGWQQVDLLNPLPVHANTNYVVSVNINDFYVYSRQGFFTDVTNGPLTAPGGNGHNGLFSSSGFPSSTHKGNNYYRDVVFEPDAELIKLSGDFQRGSVGAPLSEPLQVVIRTRDGEPVSGVTVNFSVTEGTATLSQNNVITDANGQAATNLTLGELEETVIILASALGYGSANFFADGFIDLTPPAPPTINEQLHLTQLNDSTPTISGRSESGSAVSIYRDHQFLGTVNCSPQGAWTYDASEPWPDGTYTITAVARDAAYNQSEESSALQLTIDTLAPGIPVLLFPQSESYLATVQPIISGSAEPGSRVVVFINGQDCGSTSVDSSGSWSFRATPHLGQGLHSIALRSTDEATNISPFSPVVRFTVDTSISRPVIIAPTNGTVVSARRPAIAGIAEPQSSVEIFANGLKVADVVTAAWGLWSFNAESDWQDDTYSLTARAKDLAKNVSEESLPVSLVIDTTPPQPPLLLNWQNGSQIDPQSAIELYGTAEPGSTVVIYMNGQAVAQIIVGANGQWRQQILLGEETGATTIEAVSRDLAGNVSQASSSEITISEPLLDSDQDGVLDRDEEIEQTDPHDPGSYLPDFSGVNCGGWNSYLSSWIVLEHLNVGAFPLKVVHDLRTADGIFVSKDNQRENRLAINAEEQRDIVLNGSQIPENPGYGLVCPQVLTGPSADLRGQVVHYFGASMPNDGAESKTRAYSRPVTPGVVGRQVVQVNTFFPAFLGLDATGEVWNWIELSNFERRQERGELRIYDADGRLVQVIPVKVPAQGRLDIAGHILLGENAVGQVEWLPRNVSGRFSINNTRYAASLSQDSLMSVISISGRVGSGRKLDVPIFRREEYTTVLELSNALGEALAVSLSRYTAEGELILTESVRLPAHGTRHLVLTGAGSRLVLQGQKAGALVASVVGYKQGADQRSFLAFSMAAREPLGSGLWGSYNTYLGQTCSLIMDNILQEETTVEVTIHQRQEQDVQRLEVTIPEHGQRNVDICALVPSNRYGPVQLRFLKPNSVTANLVRFNNRGDVLFVDAFSP